MAFIHARCGTPVEVFDTAHCITPEWTITTRGFTCPVCSEREGRPFHFTTDEALARDDAPTPRVRAKWAFDHRVAPSEIVADGPPRGAGAATGAFAAWAGTSAPSATGDPLDVEMPRLPERREGEA
jgi:hypothetical protein